MSGETNDDLNVFEEAYFVCCINASIAVQLRFKPAVYGEAPVEEVVRVYARFVSGLL